MVYGAATALHYMEEPKMLAETVAQWRREAVEEGWRLGVAEGWERSLPRA